MSAFEILSDRLNVNLTFSFNWLTVSDEKEQLWVWEYETEDGKHDLFMEVGETICFKVKEELFTDTLPAGPSSISAPSTSTHHETVEVAQRRIPYLIRGTINESGLGLNSWWNS